MVDKRSLDELCSSIQQYGVIEPIIVRPANGQYEVVAGTRRLLAARRVGLETLPASIRELSDSEAFEMAIAENLDRQDLTFLEIGQFLRNAQESLGWSQRRLAKSIRKDVAWVNRHLKMLEIPRSVLMLMGSNGFSEGHARHILGLPREKQIQVAKAIAAENLTTRETEMLVRRLKASPSEKKKSRSRRTRTEPNMTVNDLAPNKWNEYSKYYLQFHSIWSVTRRHDPFYGVNGTIYSGCFPLIVPINCILRYTKERELVLDPFVGSGTTLVAAAMLHRFAIGVDINLEAEKAKEKRFKLVVEIEPSLAQWIKKQRFISGDSRDLSFIEDSSVDLIITHPPYLNMMYYGEKGTYTDLGEYEVFLRDTFGEMVRVLKSGRFCCVQIAPYAAKNLPLHHIAYESALKVGFDFVDEVVLAFLADYVGYSSSVSGRDRPIAHKEAFAKWFSISRNVYNHNHEYLLILRKPP